MILSAAGTVSIFLSAEAGGYPSEDIINGVAFVGSCVGGSEVHGFAFLGPFAEVYGECEARRAPGDVFLDPRIRAVTDGLCPNLGGITSSKLTLELIEPLPHCRKVLYPRADRW